MYIGIDHNPKVIEWGNQHFPEHQFYKYNLETARVLDFPVIDTVLTIAVLEHL